MFTTAQR
jgi:hypothetical protein